MTAEGMADFLLKAAEEVELTNFGNREQMIEDMREEPKVLDFFNRVVTNSYPHLVEESDLTIAELQAEIDALVEAARKLRTAQRAYLAQRGNDTLGLKVGEAATQLDQVLDDHG